MRPGETNGVHYHFVAHEEFQSMISHQEFLEWADVHGNFYGTTRGEVDRIHELNCTPLLEIDVQGWLKSRPHLPKATSIFILPPTLETLWERLAARGTDNLKTRWLRLQNSYREIEIAEHYQSFIVNDDLDKAFMDLKSIVIDRQNPEHLSSTAGLELCRKLKKEFRNADWIQGLREQIQDNESSSS